KIFFREAEPVGEAVEFILRKPHLTGVAGGAATAHLALKLKSRVVPGHKNSKIKKASEENRFHERDFTLKFFFFK
ncbi:MAG: hypothetical protein IJK97_00535, partial [Thermoguttaceae bacterium]|nr:hypothetical protein [Thermoguttaceae bacterium]